MIIDKKFWNKKKVLITGHTGFKGGWLTVLLNFLGSKVSGYALNPVGKNNFFNSVKIKKLYENDFRKDITNLNALKKCIKIIKPEIIFHLAAQSSVIESFKNSENTVLSNVIGTTNLLEAIKAQKSVKAVVIITTDKVYQNYKIKTHFNENSTLGGDDVYSGSKASCELLINSYRKSFFQSSKCKISSVRAGNCFGGGDWTKDRIVKDALESFSSGKSLTLRSPDATRPWQHVLEPLFGYLFLAQKLFSKNGDKFTQAWNFGPSTKQNMKVIKLATLIKSHFQSQSKILINKRNNKFHNKKINIFESKNLNIDSKKAHRYLKWKPKLSIDTAVKLTVEWYLSFKTKKNLLKITENQIKKYFTTYN
jgi:CDP-glucose 4,6-dehydratase